MGLPDCRGVATSCANATAIAALDRAHERNLAFQGDAVADIDEVLVGQPDFVMGHVFKAGLLTQTMETRIYDDMVRSVQRAEALWDTANERERGHIRAVRAWVDGDFFGAVQHWEATLTTCPLDLLALQLVHLTDVLLGDVVGQRDCVARVFPLWDESIPGYEFVLGFYSFGLEENRDFGEAEELGRRALAMRPNHPYAVHAVAHVMEMKGRQSGGISFMNRYLPDWSRSDFANHLQSADPHGDKYEELDAAALLWRLELLDVDVGDRWSRLADKWQPSAQDTLYAFNDVHAMMCFVADHRTEAANKLINANARYVNHATDANVAMSREMGLPFCFALQDFVEGKYGSCVDRLLPVRYRTHRLGGSFAQRDVIGWTLLEAALRARRFDLALALANERAALKPSSPQNWKQVARAHRGLGDLERARQAEARAASVVAAV